MSDVLNHYYCARETYKELNDSKEILSIISNYYDAYRLGSQGPDFFYYDLLPNEVKQSTGIGKLLHTEKINDFFYYGLKFAQKNPEYREITLAYLFGFATHFALDINTHPFIFYRTGTDSNEKKEIKRSKKLHKFYEILLDTAMMQYEYSKLAVNLQPEKVFYVRPFTLEFLEHFYKYVLKKIYDIDLSDNVIKHALRMSGMLIAFFKDPDNTKRRIGKVIDKIAGNRKMVNRFFYPSYTNEFEILNIDKRVWKNPVTGEERSESYPELFDQAVKTASPLIVNLFELSRKDEILSSELAQLFNDKSYLTAQESGKDQKQRYCDTEFKDYLENY